MATLTVTVPDTLIPRIVAALQLRYPDLTGTAAQIGKAGVRRLLGETLAAAESRTAELAGYDAMVTAAAAARAAAETDAAAIA